MSSRESEREREREREREIERESEREREREGRKYRLTVTTACTSFSPALTKRARMAFIYPF